MYFTIEIRTLGLRVRCTVDASQMIIPMPSLSRTSTPFELSSFFIRSKGVHGTWELRPKWWESCRIRAWAGACEMASQCDAACREALRLGLGQPAGRGVHGQDSVLHACLDRLTLQSPACSSGEQAA